MSVEIILFGNNARILFQTNTRGALNSSTSDHSDSKLLILTDLHYLSPINIKLCIDWFVSQRYKICRNVKLRGINTSRASRFRVITAIGHSVTTDTEFIALCFLVNATRYLATTMRIKLHTRQIELCLVMNGRVNPAREQLCALNWEVTRRAAPGRQFFRIATYRRTVVD